jgi:hypothetical protein
MPALLVEGIGGWDGAGFAVVGQPSNVLSEVAPLPSGIDIRVAL